MISQELAGLIEHLSLGIAVVVGYVRTKQKIDKLQDEHIKELEVRLDDLEDRVDSHGA